MVVRALLYVILNYFWCNPDLSGSENLRVYISTWLLRSPLGVKQEAPTLASLALGAIKNNLVAIGSPSLAPRLNRISLSKFPAWFTLDLKSFRRISIHSLRRRPKPAILITFFKKLCPTESKVFLKSIATIRPFFLWVWAIGHHRWRHILFELPRPCIGRLQTLSDLGVWSLVTLFWICCWWHCLSICTMLIAV